MGIHLQLPPSVASCLTIAFIVFLFRRDIRERPNVTGALWLPLIWLVIGCSRGLSLWLNIFGIQVSGAASVEEGSPLDAWSFRNRWEQSMAHNISPVLFGFHYLV